MEEEEEDQQSDAPSLKRRALFVVIYAPKRGILEVTFFPSSISLICLVRMDQWPFSQLSRPNHYVDPKTKKRNVKLK